MGGSLLRVGVGRWALRIDALLTKHPSIAANELLKYVLYTYMKIPFLTYAYAPLRKVFGKCRQVINGVI